MNTQSGDSHIRVLIADDDEHILKCYQEAFSMAPATGVMKTLDLLDAELFDSDADESQDPVFDVVACSQGDDAVSLATKASNDGHPFDVVILDIRMPPGIDGVEAGSAIRELDSEVEIVFVSGYSDVPRDELERRVPPPMRLHCFSKPLSFLQLATDVANMVKAH
jgi:CheY-like chemotaxis protein